MPPIDLGRAGRYTETRKGVAGVSNESVCRPDMLLALATDTDVRIPGALALPLDGYKQAAWLIFSCARLL